MHARQEDDVARAVEAADAERLVLPDLLSVGTRRLGGDEAPRDLGLDSADRARERGAEGRQFTRREAAARPLTLASVVRH